MRKKAKYRNHLSVNDVFEAVQDTTYYIPEKDTHVLAPISLDTTSEVAKRQEEWRRQEAEKENERKQKEADDIAKRKKRNIIIFMAGFFVIFMLVLRERKS
jgi:esterase/lipase superfamily enzyme